MWFAAAEPAEGADDRDREARRDGAQIVCAGGGLPRGAGDDACDSARRAAARRAREDAHVLSALRGGCDWLPPRVVAGRHRMS